MGIVLVDVTMSLDGFIAGPDDAMDWVFDFFDLDQPDDVVDEARRTTGAALAGRRCYDVGRRATRSETSSLFGGGWSGPEFVLTHHPPDDESRESFTFLSGDIRQAVATAFGAAGDKNLLVLGADVPAVS